MGVGCTLGLTDGLAGLGDVLGIDTAVLRTVASPPNQGKATPTAVSPATAVSSEIHGRRCGRKPLLDVNRARPAEPGPDGGCGPDGMVTGRGSIASERAIPVGCRRGTGYGLATPNSPEGAISGSAPTRGT